MKKRTDRPQLGTAEFDSWLQQRIAQRFKDFESVPDLEEEFGVQSGSLQNLTNTDAEAFPNEPEEYMPHERVKLVVDNSHNKKKD